MADGGKLMIQTANVDLDLAYARQHPGSRVGQYVMLAVRDTGTGIDPEIQSQIFEPFFTTKERDKGTGLGLATVYGVVKQSGGYIAVDSEKGKGACFSVYLPCVGQSASAAETKTGQPASIRGSETVLLVEDAEGLRKLANMFLRDSGYRVLTAPARREELEGARSSSGSIHL